MDYISMKQVMISTNILVGEGKAICDGQEELLSPGMCHICKKGSEHSIENTGDEDLILLTVVVEH